MKTYLERIRELLSGAADEETIDNGCEGLYDSESRSTTFFSLGKMIADRPFAIDWRGLAETATEREIESAAEPDNDIRSDSSALEILPKSVTQPCEKTKLEQVRDILSGNMHGCGSRFPVLSVEDSQHEGEIRDAKEPVPSGAYEGGNFKGLTEEQLLAVLARAQPDNDVRAAFEHVWLRSYAKLMAVVYRWSRSDRPATEEIVQETFVRFWKAVQQNRFRDVNNVDHYLIQVARKMSIIFYRERRRSRPLKSDTITTHLGVSERTVQRETSQRLLQAIRQLPTLHRRMIMMFYLDHKSLQEIAIRLGVTPESVSLRLCGVRKLLKKIGQFRNMKRSN